MIKNLIKLPVSVIDRNIISDKKGMFSIVLSCDYLNENELHKVLEDLCNLINAQSGEVDKLAEAYAEKMYPKSDDYANVRMRQALRESHANAVLYGAIIAARILS